MSLLRQDFGGLVESLSLRFSLRSLSEGGCIPGALAKALHYHKPKPVFFVYILKCCDGKLLILDVLII